jgi:hypothetical protein
MLKYFAKQVNIKQININLTFYNKKYGHQNTLNYRRPTFKRNNKKKMLKTRGSMKTEIFILK